MSNLLTKRNPLYEKMSYGERVKFEREREKSRRELAKTLKKDTREIENEKEPKENPIPPIVRLGIAKCYRCTCGKEFYAMRLLNICPFCSVAGKVSFKGNLLGKHKERNRGN